MNDVQIYNYIIIFDKGNNTDESVSTGTFDIMQDLPQAVEDMLIQKGIKAVYFNFAHGQLNDNRYSKKVLFIHKNKTIIDNVKDFIFDYKDIGLECYNLILYTNNREGIELQNFKNVKNIQVDNSVNTVTQIKLQNCIGVSLVTLQTSNINKIEIENSEINSLICGRWGKTIDLLKLANMKSEIKLHIHSVPKKVEINSDKKVSVSVYDYGSVDIIDCEHSFVKLETPDRLSGTKFLHTENAFIFFPNISQFNEYEENIPKIVPQKIHFVSFNINYYDEFLNILQLCTEPVQVDIIKISSFSENFLQSKKLGDYTINADLIPDNIQFIFEGNGFKNNEITLKKDFLSHIGKPVSIQVIPSSINNTWYEIEG
jgi:hypothetical protein